MSDNIICTSESPEFVVRATRFSTGQQTVINKLFRRLIVFYSCCLSSFCDRINIGFAGLDDGAGSGVKRHHVWPADDVALYATYVIFGIPSNVMLSIAGARRWIALHYGAISIASTATMLAVDRKLVCCECWWVLPKRFAVNIAHFNLLVPGIFSAPAPTHFSMIAAMPATALVDCLRLFCRWTHIHPYVMAVVIPAGSDFRQFVRHYGSGFTDDTPAKAKWLTAEDVKNACRR